MLPPACEKGWTNASRSIGCRFPSRCIDAWRPPTSSKARSRSADEDSPGVSLAGRWHGEALGGLGLPGDGKELSQDYGLPRSVDVGRDPERIEVCRPTGGGV